MAKLKEKIVAIVGPTASGKSSWAVELAKEFSGEVISADSRQIYKGLDIASGKITPTEKQGIPHHLLDIADPAAPEIFSLALYLKEARETLANIQSRQKLPIIVGGTGLYVSALLENYELPEVEPNQPLRDELNKSSLAQLQEIYRQLDSDGFNKIDTQNSRRLIRAIEVVKATGKSFFTEASKHNSNALIISIEISLDTLKTNIQKRLEERFAMGMLNEVIELHTKGVSWERFIDLGFEYRWLVKLAQKEISQDEAVAGMLADSLAYAKRQLTWWRKRNVLWCSSLADARTAIKEYLGN